jgi:hypothetical protein
MAVASEAGVSGDLRIVVRAADRQFAYKTRGDDIALSDEEYSFAPRARLSWQNPANPNDISGDGAVVPLDVILMINDLNRRGPRQLPTETVVRQIDSQHYYLDATGDGHATPLDVLQVINSINRRAAGGEGEPAGAFLRQPAWRVDVDQPVAEAELVDGAIKFDDVGVSSFDQNRSRQLPQSVETPRQSDSLEEYVASLDRVFWEE